MKTPWLPGTTIMVLLSTGLLTVACREIIPAGRERKQPAAQADDPPAQPREEPLKDVPVDQVLKAVVIQNIKFDGEPMGEAIELTRKHLDRHCERKRIVPITIESAESPGEMSFGSSAMTARMLLDMIASEARMDLKIDREKRVVSFKKRLR